MRAVVVSSYPRSGNTWVRFVLATAVRGARPSSMALNETMPDAHRPLPQPEKWTVDPAFFLKSHFKPKRLAAYLNGFARAAPPDCRIDDIKVVHIVRNPFDVALSLKKFYEVGDDIFPAFYGQFVKPDMVVPATFAKWGFGNWRSNNAEWLHEAKAGVVPVKLVRYEDLKARPAAVFQEVLDFAGVTPALPLDACLDLCAPAALRRLEDAEVAAGAPGLFGAYQANKQGDARFVNDAAAGGYRAKLSEAQIQAGLDSLGDLMAALGYDVAAYRAVA